MPNISYSAWSNWAKCPYKYKIIYKDKVRLFKGNIHTAFGKAIHETIELILKENIKFKLSDLNKRSSFIDKKFNELFLFYFNDLPEKEKELSSKEAKDLFDEMLSRGSILAVAAVKQLHIEFPNFKVLSIEEEISETIYEFENSAWDFNGQINDADFNFKGFLDLAIQTPDKRIHIIDWKTTSWGWEPEKKSDKIITYQLTYYKHFFSLKNEIDYKDIDVYFGLIKRTAFDKEKKPKNNMIEIFKVPCGPKKVKNALNILNQAVYNIHKENYPKNKLSCNECEYNHTTYCP